ncbi:Ionotropic receptor 457 [Blattella germanica]|nr:Ionotropic receptor 457 [Blattella germanica]
MGRNILHLTHSIPFSSHSSMWVRGRFCQIIFLSLVLKGGTNPLPLDSVSPVEDSLSRCVAKIANEYFNRDLPTALFVPYREYESHSYFSTNDSHVDYLVQSLQQRINHPLVMLDYHNNPQPLNREVKLGSYIIILSGDVSSYIDMAIEVSVTIYKVAGHMSPSGRLLIATTGSPNKERHIIIGKLFQVIWRALEISEAILLLPRIRSTDDNVIEVYKWFPEEQDDPCLQFLNRFVSIDIWFVKVNKFLLNLKLFQDNVITDMRGCVLNANVNEYPPLVVRDTDSIVGTLVHQLHITCDILNLGMNLNIGDLTSKSNMQVPAAFRTDSDMTFLQDCVATYPYFIQNLKWLVPAGAPVPRWKSLINIFNPSMWLCVVTTFLIGSATSWLLLKENQQSVTFMSVILDTLLTYLAAGISDRYKGTVASTFFVIWLFYCLIINTAYQSALISFLTDPGQEEPIKTIKELHNSGLRLMSRLLILNAEDDEIAEINSYEICEVHHLCFRSIAQNRDTALLDEELLARSLMENFFDSETNRYKLHIIDESSYTFYFTMATYTHGCLLFKRMEQLVHRIWSAGLIIKSYDYYYMVVRRRSHELVNNNPYAIALSHLQGGFYLLASGLFVSLIVFLIEVMYQSV